MVGPGHDRRHVDVRVAGVRLRERLLRLRLEPVVEFLGDPVPQLVEQRLDVEPGHQHAEQPPHPGQLGEVADQRPPGTGVLHLDGDGPAVLPDRPVHLADGRGRGGSVVEGDELRPPLWPEVTREHPVHAAHGQRRRGFLQPRQGGTVRLGELGRQRRLEDRQRLAELHRAALELAKHPEDLVGGALLDLPGDELRGPAADALAKAERGPAREPERQPG